MFLVVYGALGGRGASQRDPGLPSHLQSESDIAGLSQGRIVLRRYKEMEGIPHISRIFSAHEVID